MTITIDKDTRLELIAKQHAEGLYSAVNNNRAHLSEFLPWVDNMQSVDNFKTYIQYCQGLYQQKQEVSFVIVLDDSIVGRIGLHYLNWQNKKAEIGYWLTKDAEGRGIITRSCRALIHYGFNDLGLHRIEIKAATKNLKSQAIPQKLNFKKEGILRQAELVNNAFLDLALYSVLSDEWAERTSNG